MFSYQKRREIIDLKQFPQEEEEEEGGIDTKFFDFVKIRRQRDSAEICDHVWK